MADLARRDTNNQNLRYGKTHTEQIYIFFLLLYTNIRILFVCIMEKDRMEKKRINNRGTRLSCEQKATDKVELLV